MIQVLATTSPRHVELSVVRVEQHRVALLRWWIHDGRTRRFDCFWLLRCAQAKWHLRVIIACDPLIPWYGL